MTNEPLNPAFTVGAVSCCTSCNGEGEVEKNIWRGEEGMQIEMDVMVVCSECDGTGSCLSNQNSMSNKKPTKKLIEAVEAFNKLYPIGTELIVADDFGVETKRTLLSEAWIIGNHSAIAKFSGISGGYNIFRVKMKMKYKTNDLGMSYLVPSDANGVAV